MINALNFFALLMILHYSLTILNINANAILFVNANTHHQWFHSSLVEHWAANPAIQI